MAENTKNDRKEWKNWIPEETYEHMKAARKARRESMRSILPPEFFVKRDEARKEMLLAARSFIDHALEYLEKESKV